MDGIKKNVKKDRSFGLIIGILLLGYSAYSYYKYQTILPWFIVSGFFITITSCFIPRVIHPLRVGMEFAGRWMGIINTYILLTLIYILLFIPVSLIYKMIGNDILKLKRDKNILTYWMEKPHQENSSMKNQF